MRTAWVVTLADGSPVRYPAGAADYAETHELNVDAGTAQLQSLGSLSEATSREGGRPVVEIRDALADGIK